LERQLTLYTEASQIAATIATVEDRQVLDKSVQRFWQLYWGELALVENKEVEGAMVAIGNRLKKTS
jgi:hypothetical protein